MKTRIQKWGRGLALRIPKAAAKKAGFTRGLEVEIHAGKEELVIRACRKRKYTLAELLKGVRPENIHPEFDWGPPVGKEVW